MCTVLIIADDLSGASDCGTAFAGAGLRTRVVLEGSAFGADATVLSLDANTRAMKPHQAAARAARLMRKCSSKDQIVFKKLDSTLRGNVGPELASVLRVRREVFPRALAVLAPAFPANGRTTVQGRQFLHGRPLDETEIWRREGRPGNSCLAEIVAVAGMRSALLSLGAIRSKNNDLLNAIRALTETTDVLVCDAENDQDLRTIASISAGLGPGTVWAGSAGLAYHLAEASCLQRVEFTPPGPLISGPTLFVIGTRASMSREQAHTLSTSAGLTVVTVQPQDLVAGATAINACEGHIMNTLVSGNDVVVLLGDEKVEHKNARSLSRALAGMLAPCAESAGALVATGGETARAILQEWGISALRPVQELAPGVPFCIAENWHRRLPVITKAGDFGCRETLLLCHRFLCGLDRVCSHSRGL